MRLDKIDNPRQKRYEQRLTDFVLLILSATFCYFLSSLTKPKAVFLASLRLCFVAFSEQDVATSVLSDEYTLKITYKETGGTRTLTVEKI